MTMDIDARQSSRFEAALSTLRRELTDGSFESADMLPSERDLSERLAVSRTTLRRVLARLVEENVLSQRQGVGTFVNRDHGAKAPYAHESFSDFAAELAREGRSHSHREIGRLMGRPTMAEAIALGLSLESEIMRLTRLHYAEGEVFALERVVLPADLFDRTVAVGASLASTLADRDLEPRRVLEEVKAGTVPDADAAAMDIQKGSPALFLTRAYYLAKGRCCASARSICRADRYALSFERRDFG